MALFTTTVKAQQQVISLQYETNGSPVVSGSAGVIPESQWNAPNLGYVVPGTYTASNLVDSTGAATSISESTACCGAYDHPYGGGFVAGTGDADLFGGFALGNYGGINDVVLTVSGLDPTKTYSLITYVSSSDTTSGVLSGSINVAGFPTYYLKASALGVYTQGLATTSSAAANGNYFEFTNITGVSTVTFTLVNTTGGAGLACLYGFQLVANNSNVVAPPANCISNENFEAASPLAYWTTYAPTDTTVAASASAQSPFTPGSNGVEIKVSPGASTIDRPYLYQYLAPAQSGVMTVNFDFEIPSSNTYAGSDTLCLVRLYDNNGQNCSVGFTGIKGITFGGASFANAYNFNTWYHAVLKVPSIASVQAGKIPVLTITPWIPGSPGAPGTPAVFTPSTEPWTAFTGSSYSLLQVNANAASEQGTDLYIDNVEASPALVYAHYMPCYIHGGIWQATGNVGHLVITGQENFANWPPALTSPAPNPIPEMWERTWFSARYAGSNGLFPFCDPQHNANLPAVQDDFDLAGDAGLDAFAMIFDHNFKVSPTSGPVIAGQNTPAWPASPAYSTGTQFTNGIAAVGTVAASNSVKIFPDLWDMNPWATAPKSDSDVIADMQMWGAQLKSFIDANPNAFLKRNGRYVISISQVPSPNYSAGDSSGPPVTWALYSHLFDAWGTNGAENFYIISLGYGNAAGNLDSAWYSAPDAYSVWSTEESWGDHEALDALNQNNLTLPQQAATSAKALDWPVCLGLFTPRNLGSNAGVTENLGVSSLCDNWHYAINNAVPLVEVQTWNDFSEDHAITETNYRGDTLIELTNYFASWLRSGTPPPIPTEKVFIFHHRQLVNLTKTALTGTTLGIFNFDGYYGNGYHCTPLVDYLDVVTLLNSPATVSVMAGSGSSTLNAKAPVQAPAGESEWLVYTPSSHTNAWSWPAGTLPENTSSTTNWAQPFSQNGSYPATTGSNWTPSPGNARQVTAVASIPAGYPSVTLQRNNQVFGYVQSRAPIGASGQYCDLAVLGTEAVANSASNTNLISNANFESGSLSPWGATFTAPNSVTVDTAASSPFVAGGAYGLDLYDGDSTKQRNVASQNFTLTDAFLDYSFDLEVPVSTTYTGSDGVALARIFDSSGGNSVLQFAGNGNITFGSAARLGTFSKGTWYHVEIIAPSIASGQTAAVLNITPFGGLQNSYYLSNGWTGYVSGAKYKSLTFQNSYSSESVVHSYFDNVQIKPLTSFITNNAPISTPAP